jgi:iron complex outermembrane receptor protein
MTIAAAPSSWVGVCRSTLVLLIALSVSSPAQSQVRVPDIIEMSIEDLMRIDVTGVSRKEERASDVAAAVFVITHDAIRRSGMTSLPDLLRLAPGVDVAQINASKFAVSVRGFNGLRANKVLVLLDGRSAYNRLFSGVFWDEQDVMVDDIERIEVIRGPGATIWGANAVNGVINIITKAAVDTQGGLVRVDAGLSGQQAAVRYGGSLGDTRYRLFSQWTGQDGALTAPAVRSNDSSRILTAGFRADRATQPSALLVEGAFTVGRTHALWQNLDPRTNAAAPISNDHSESRNGHLLGRLTRTRPGTGTLQVQGFIDLAHRQEPVADLERRIIDIDTQYHRSLARHDLVAGAGYRFIDERFSGHTNISMVPAESTASVVTAFAQDDIALFGSRLVVTLGSQFQYDSASGAGIQPTARAIWKGLPRQRFWAAVSRALRTPSLEDRLIRVSLAGEPANGLPVTIAVVGNPEATTEELVEAEAGYRLEIGNRASIDVTGFEGRYDHLRTFESEAPIVSFIPTPQVFVTTRAGNQLEATTRGLEVAGAWAPISYWRLDGSYSAFRFTPHLAPGSSDTTAATADGDAPRHKWQLRSEFSPGTRARLSMAIFRTGPLARLAVDAYTRADVNAEWRFTNELSAMVVGQNLLDEAHTEFRGSNTLLLETMVPRSVTARLRWTFR